MTSKRVIVQSHVDRNSPYVVLNIRGAESPQLPFMKIRINARDLVSAVRNEEADAARDTIDAELVTG